MSFAPPPRTALRTRQRDGAQKAKGERATACVVAVRQASTPAGRVLSQNLAIQINPGNSTAPAREAPINSSVPTDSGLLPAIRNSRCAGSPENGTSSRGGALHFAKVAYPRNPFVPRWPTHTGFEAHGIRSYRGALRSVEGRASVSRYGGRASRRCCRTRWLHERSLHRDRLERQRWLRSSGRLDHDRCAPGNAATPCATFRRLHRLTPKKHIGDSLVIPGFGVPDPIAPICEHMQRFPLRGSLALS
jgi:hypothetical protein